MKSARPHVPKSDLPCCAYTLGITEHTCGKNNVMSVANLQMILGNLGKEYGGRQSPARGQNNVQGACDMGAHCPMCSNGYQKVDGPCRESEIRRRHWGVEKRLSEISPGIMVPQMLDGLIDKKDC